MSGNSKLAPSSNLTTESNGKTRLALNSFDMIALQAYVKLGSLVPTNDEELKEKTGIEEDISKFATLLNVYNDVKSHCVTFRDVTFGESVSCASDIYNYGKSAKTFMGAVLKIIEKWTDANAKESQKKLEEIVNKLIEKAQGYTDKTTKVIQKFHQFRLETESDNSKLEPLHQNFEEIIGRNVDDLFKEIDNAMALIKKYNEEYSKNVAAASSINSLPTFTFGIIGFIAAPIIAGIHDKETKALEQVRTWEKKLEELNTELKARVKFKMEVMKVDKGLSALLENVGPAIHTLELIEGCWKSIVDDLTDIRKSLKEEIIDPESAFIKELGVENAIESWTAVAQLADEYRQIAFISEKSYEEIKQNPDKYKISTST